MDVPLYKVGHTNLYTVEIYTDLRNPGDPEFSKKHFGWLPVYSADTFAQARQYIQQNNLEDIEGVGVEIEIDEINSYVAEGVRILKSKIPYFYQTIGE